MPRAIAALLLSFVAVLGTDAAHAQDRQSFGVTVAGVNAGTLTLVSREAGGTYEVQGAAQSTGLVGAFARLRVDASAQGRVNGNRYAPSAYVERRTDRDGTATKRIRYRSGTPQVTEDPPDTDRKPYHAAAAGQRGTVDPLTILFALLRDRPRPLACALDLRLYDGQRVSRLRLGSPQATGAGGLTCAAIWTREAGYSPSEMSERQRWPFTVSYRAGPGGTMLLEEVRLPLTFGLMRIRRR